MAFKKPRKNSRVRKPVRRARKSTSRSGRSNTLRIVVQQPGSVSRPEHPAAIQKKRTF
jgi:hypothetical protein